MENILSPSFLLSFFPLLALSLSLSFYFHQILGIFRGKWKGKRRKIVEKFLIQITEKQIIEEPSREMLVWWAIFKFLVQHTYKTYTLSLKPTHTNTRPFPFQVYMECCQLYCWHPADVDHCSLCPQPLLLLLLLLQLQVRLPLLENIFVSLNACHSYLSDCLPQLHHLLLPVACHYKEHTKQLFNLEFSNIYLSLLFRIFAVVVSAAFDILYAVFAGDDSCGQTTIAKAVWLYPLWSSCKCTTVIHSIPGCMVRI